MVISEPLELIDYALNANAMVSADVFAMEREVRWKPGGIKNPAGLIRKLINNSLSSPTGEQPIRHRLERHRYGVKAFQR